MNKYLIIKYYKVKNENCKLDSIDHKNDNSTIVILHYFVIKKSHKNFIINRHNLLTIIVQTFSLFVVHIVKSANFSKITKLENYPINIEETLRGYSKQWH